MIYQWMPFVLVPEFADKTIANPWDKVSAISHEGLSHNRGIPFNDIWWQFHLKWMRITQGVRRTEFWETQMAIVQDYLPCKLDGFTVEIMCGSFGKSFNDNPSNDSLLNRIPTGANFLGSKHHRFQAQEIPTEWGFGKHNFSVRRITHGMAVGALRLWHRQEGFAMLDPHRILARYMSLGLQTFPQTTSE